MEAPFAAAYAASLSFVYRVRGRDVESVVHDSMNAAERPGTASNVACLVIVVVEWVFAANVLAA
jgi:hypothetical protein